MIAWHVDPWETFTQCIIREAQEEAWIIIKKEDLEVVHMMHRDSGQKEYNERIDVFFVVKRRDGTLVNKEPNKCDDLSRFSLNQIPDNVIPYIKQAIDCIKENIPYSEFWRH